MKRPPKASNIIEKLRHMVAAGRIIYSAHANLRLKERRIIKPEVEDILRHGYHEARKDQFNEEIKAWDYAIKGETIDGRKLRIIVGFIEPHVLIVTAIDLEKR